MFRPVAMNRLSVVVLERDERTVLRHLGESGAVQLTRTPSGPDTAPLAPRDRSGELARCDRLLTRVADLCRSLEIVPSARGPAPTDMTLSQAEQDLRVIEEQAGDRLNRRQRLLQRWSELSAVCDRVSAYRGLDLPLDQLDRFSFLHFVTGSLPAENFDRLPKDLGENVALLTMPEHNGRLPLIAMTTRRRRLALEEALQQAGFQRETLPAVEGATSDTLSDASRREREQMAADLEQANAQVRSWAAEVALPLARIEHVATIERRLLEAEQNFPRTNSAVMLTGWVPAADAPALGRRLSELTGARCVIQAAPPGQSPEEQIPVLLRHPGWLRPFQLLVGAYGLPNYRELEPTLFVAVSYVLMFGMMFGDAGQGAVLALGGLALWRAGRSAGARDGGLLLLFAGLSSIVFGIIYGSYFGLTSLKHYALWHDPLEGDPMKLMYGAIGFGMVMISLGLILNVINRFRRGDVLGGLLDKFGLVGMLFYWGALALLTKLVALESGTLMKLAVIVFFVLPIIGWAVKEPIEYFAARHAKHTTRAHGSLFEAMTESLVGAFEAVLSYLANTISFVRLAAYAMSHAALLVAAFMMAGEVKHLSPGGGVLSVFIIILGNLVAIILEGIIASVQALRLEYYEFFGKFYSGSGQPFKPFRLARYEQAST